MSFSSRGQNDKADSFFNQKALTIAKKTGDRQSEGIALRHMGDTCHVLGQYEKSIVLFEKNLVIADESKDEDNMSLCHLKIDACHLSMGS